MTISTTCPGCGKAIAAPDTAAGHKARCPFCSQVVDIPGTLASAAPLVHMASAPTPSRNGSASPSRAATTIDRMLARTSPYGSLRMMAAIVFGFGLVAGVVLFIGGVATLIILSKEGYHPLIGVAIFLGALLLSALAILGSKIVSELLRLWADMGDRTRQMVHMLDESLSRGREMP